MILLCYDGSADAQAAIDQAGLLMAGSEATVLVIWETILETMTRHGSLGIGMIGPYGDDRAADDAIKQAAVQTAVAGRGPGRGRWTGRPAEGRQSRRRHRRHDPRRSRQSERRRHRPGDARPRKREVADAR